ncbi:aromatic amino acid ammonia-lyase [Streptomyces canus]|uniref:aromatic amino acid ammonia-lyase n=1 Tax=Streptomyces canus TaxID=58343 RepID=UPI003CE9D2A5
MDPTAPGPVPPPPAPEATRVVLNGISLTVGELIALADGAAVPAVAPEARERAVRSWRTAQRLAAAGRLYGRGTGVGAHRAVTVDADDETAHGLRLLRSHAGGAGALLPARQIRAMLAIRANQLLAGGSGIQPAFVDALIEALRLGVHPAVNEYGGIGTGDLTALAQTGLTLIGERPWLDSEVTTRRGREPGAHPDGADALLDGRSTAGLYDWLDNRRAGDRGADPDGRPAAGAVGGGRGGPGAGSRTRSDLGVPVGEDARVGDGPASRADDGRSGVPSRRSGEGGPATGPARGAEGRRGAPAPTSAGVASGRLPAPVTLRPGDALALLSSNALALAQAAFGRHALDVLLRATHAVAALSLAAVSGSPEAYAAPVHALRPYPGAARAAGEVRRLLGLPDRPSGPGRRIQDPYGFRAFPQVHGCALDAAERLREVVEVEINCPSENPLVAPDGTGAYHHGGFFAAPLGLALEAANLALLQTAQLSTARLTALGDPGLTGLTPFLAAGPASSSGTMILEYTAHSALAEVRACAAPASTGHAVLSRGLEEAASFAGQAARQTLRATDAYATVLACELVTAVRALRLHPARPRTAVLTVADAALPDGVDDRPLTQDVRAAAELLPKLAEL